MAARAVHLIEPLDGEETGEEFSRKKKSKFQTFKNFFSKKKKNKEPSSPTGGESKLKTSQSSNDVSLDSSILHLPAEPGLRGGMGNKALSHDSIFIFESLPDITGKTSSQENLPGKVKALQLPLQQNLWLGAAPLGIRSRKAEDPGTLSEEGGLPRRPPEISTLHDVLDGSRRKVPSVCSSRPLSPWPSAQLGCPPATVTCRRLPIDFNSLAIPLGRLDTSAARHRIAMNPRKHKAFAHRGQTLSVEKEQCLLGMAEGKTSHTKLLEASESQEEDWEGLSIRNARNLNGTRTNDALPTTRACDALCYSWNVGPGTCGICILAPEDQNLLVTDLQASVTVSCLKAPSSLRKCEGEEEVEEAGEGTGGRTREGLERNPQSSRDDVVETTGSLQAESAATGFCEAMLSALQGNVIGEDAAGRIHASCPQPVEQKAEDARVGSDATSVEGTEGGPGGGNGSVTLEADPALSVLQCPLSAVEAPSEAERAPAPALGSSPTVKEDVRRTADVELQLFEGRAKPTDTSRGISAILDAGLDSPLLQSAAGEKPFLPKEHRCSVPSGGPGKEEADAIRKLGSLSSGPPAAGAAEDAPKSSLPNANAGDHSGGVKMRGESQAPDEIAKSLAMSASAKPVRFTVAPAWQRSLSGGSNAVEGACSRSTPTSPIRPELFEGMPPLEPAAQGCVWSSLEGLSGGSGDVVVAHLHSAAEGLGRKSPFGVKLRRTSSLLKYQAEQQQQQQPPPKQVPPAAAGASSASVIEQPKSAVPGTPPQNRTTSTKALATKSSFKEDRNPPKVKAEERMAKRQTGRPASEQMPAGRLEAPSSEPEPAWISMAKQKQKGFQGHPLAKGLKREGKPFAQTEQERETSQQEKDVNPPGEKVMQKSSTRHVGALEREVQSKVMSASLTKGPVRTPTREAPSVGTGPRLTLSLPLSLCSPADPPWLSLAKKKSKAWSEMPQIVQ